MVWGLVRPANDLDVVRAAAADLIGRGFAVCALDPDSKKPAYPEWSITLLKPEDFLPGEGVGLLTGPISGTSGHALVVIDLDSREAVRLADKYLPPTPMMEGRVGKPNSHRGYMVPLNSIPPDKFSGAPMAGSAAMERYGHPGPKTEHFAKMLDLIGTGGQVVVPPTLHSSGGAREWTGGRPGVPAVVPYPDLLRAVHALLSACGYVPPKKTVQLVNKAPAGPKTRTSIALDSLTPVVRVDGALRRRIEAYLDATPPAVSEEGGHSQTFSVACALIWGFALDTDTALGLLVEKYNPRCVPPWNLDELMHKVASALTATNHKHPRGHLLHRPRKTRPAIITPWITA
jgi:hypothetical protein